MATDIDIVNTGLAHLGNEALVQSINPPDGSAEADHCARFYPIARDKVLEWGWSFNTRRESMSALVEEPIGGWTFAYSLPNNCLRVLAVYNYGETDENNVQPFVQETNSSGELILYTDVEDATVKYAVGITDTAKFSPSCITALGRMMAHFLAGPLIKGAEGQKVSESQYKLAIAEWQEAMRMDAMANNLGTIQNFVPNQLAARDA